MRWLTVICAYCLIVNNPGMSQLFGGSSNDERNDDRDDADGNGRSDVEDNRDAINDMKEALAILTEQLKLTQQNNEMHRRRAFHSGIKQGRVERGGSRPYFYDSFTGRRLAGVHNHPETIRTIGMSEVTAFLNGVEFNTRHNDYLISAPPHHNASSPALVDIPFPDVPPSVRRKETVEEQVAEMREYFRAFVNSDRRIRFYEKYFVPVLCYMEGFWTTETVRVQDPFKSERHELAVSTWKELRDVTNFVEQTGRKQVGENLANLPSKVIGLDDRGIPIIVNWNYRIACHKLEEYVHYNYLKPIEDLTATLQYRLKTEEQKFNHRGTRFRLHPAGKRWPKQFREQRHRTEYLDLLMGEIPGLDGYGASHVDEGFNELARPADAQSKSDEALNTAYYHRYFKDFTRETGTLSFRKRGYADASLFMAMNNRADIVANNNTHEDYCGREDENSCGTVSQKWSYAIPLEIVYLTPLSKWNPHNLRYQGLGHTKEGKEATKGGRNGGLTPETAFNGTNSKNYYITPVEFFTGAEVGKMMDDADTGKQEVGVLDRDGIVHPVRASGHRVILPYINNVGYVRQRFPIHPIADMGTPGYKELEGLKDVLFENALNDSES